MADEGLEEPGTGLRDVFNMLAKLPQERLLSLTFQLGVSPQDKIIHAFCLIILRKGEEAMNTLQMLKESFLAKHLVENWQISGGKVEEFGLKCGYFNEFEGESLAELARLFRVLYEKRMCDAMLRNLAYKRALSNDKQKISFCNNEEYVQLRQEAELICGPEFAQWPSVILKSGSDSDPESGQDDGSSMNLSSTEPTDTHNVPSSLQVNSMPSYPSHLEISQPPTVPFQEDKVPPEPSDKPCSIAGLCIVSKDKPIKASGSYGSFQEPQPESSQRPSKLVGDSKVDMLASQDEAPRQTNTGTSTDEKLTENSAAIMFSPKMDDPNVLQDCESDEEDEEAIFYSFVILHAPQDVDMAESMRERLESIVGSRGAIFSEDFAIPGRSTLRCVEDAINNSAFTILLLTCNFNTRMLEMKTDSALISSINKTHKHNTVIPLLPRENCMPRDRMPVVLQTINPIRERGSFEVGIKKALTPRMIKNQKKIWEDEQKIKAQKKRQERLMFANKRQKQLIDETQRSRNLEQERMRLIMQQRHLLPDTINQHRIPGHDGGDVNAWLPSQQPTNINIENAQYIMIGDNSKMNVELVGNVGKDHLNDKDEKE